MDMYIDNSDDEEFAFTLETAIAELDRQEEKRQEQIALCERVITEFVEKLRGIRHPLMKGKN